MALIKYKLGSFLLPFSESCMNPNLSIYDVSGINADKEFFEPSKQVGADTSNYQNVPPNYFACNLMHVGRDRVLPIAYNYSDDIKVVSPAYTVFSIDEKSPLLPEYLFMMIKSKEKDRYFWFHTDSSVRDGMSWDDFCNLEIEIPPLPIQQKYVDIYHAMLANQRSYERGLDDLRLASDAYIDNLCKKIPAEKIGPYLIESDRRNGLDLSIDSVRGLATSKEIIPTKADMTGVNLSNYKTVLPRQIAYVPDTSRRGDKISLGLNNTDETFLVSSISIVFDTNREKLLPEYLMLFLTRPEFDRYARFHSWGSVREIFSFGDMRNVEIPIPDISVQKALADLYSVYTQRKAINERLKAQIKGICPILIKGAIEEARQ